MPTRSTRGFSLIEILIALVVLAVGLLGTLALQLATLRTSRVTGDEASALQIATEIAEQLRNHARSPEIVTMYAQVALSATLTFDEGAGSVSCFGSEANCNSVELAAFDIQQWKALIRNRLPGGRLRICRDAQPWQLSTRSMQWACSDSANAKDPLWIKLGWRADRDGSGAHQTYPPQLFIPVGILMKAGSLQR